MRPENITVCFKNLLSFQSITQTQTFMRNLILSFVLICFLSMSAFAQKLTLKWKSDTLLRVPESVLFDATRNKLYVANIDGGPWEKDGKGSIGVLSTDGKIEKVEWVTGLDAPKGMGLYKNNLYVADVSRVVVIDVTSGKITEKIEIDGTKNLNDVTVSKDGQVFISDSGSGKSLYRQQRQRRIVFRKLRIKRNKRCAGYARRIVSR